MSLTSSVARSHSSVRYAWSFAIWFALALLFSALGVLTPERRFAIPVIIAGAFGALVFAYRRDPGFRSLAEHVDLRIVLALHAVRAAAGAAFLALMHAGRLTPEFALVAGWGDIAAGSGALALMPGAGTLLTGFRRRALAAWNTFALADILLVVFTAQRILLVRGDVEAMRGLLDFPGPVLPLFLVPLVLATHVLVFVRLKRERAGSAVAA
jgi:hypothetical protein